MASVQAFISIAVIVISFIIGLIFYYHTSNLLKDNKGKQIEEIVSQLINFVFFIWIGKIVLNMKVFITDPLTILAYPSNSHAFYLATLLTVLNIIYKKRKTELDAQILLATFVPVFLAASFIYEFFDIVWKGNTYTWGYLGLLMALLVLYMIFYDRTFTVKLSYLLFLGWSVGKFSLAVKLPFTTVFGYTVSSWFLMIIIILLSILTIFECRRKVF